MAKEFNLQYLTQSFDDGLIKKSRLIKTDKYVMGAITTKGTNPKREENHDYSFISSHYRSDDIAFMLIADGKDDIKGSDEAAKLLVRNLERWFKGLSKTEINTPMILEPRLLGELRILNQDVFKYYYPAQVSFALALRGKDETFIANLGNCRCYSINDDNVSLQTTDSLKWYVYNNPKLINPDEVKFLCGKDVLERGIGCAPNNKRKFEPFVSIVDNDDYDSLVLTTHGVTDVLDSDEIQTIILDNNIDGALYELAYQSLGGPSKELPNEIIERFGAENHPAAFIEKTIPGDSSASAIVYKKVRKNS